MNNQLRAQRLLQRAKLILPTFLEIHKEILGGRTGIYLAIQEIDLGHSEEKMIWGEVIGELSEEKTTEKKNFAIEKIDRMRANNEICSFMSEDVDNKQFGGGIKATRFFIAPSGLPPHMDQSFAVFLAYGTDELTIPEREAIEEVSQSKVSEWREKAGDERQNSKAKA